MRIITGADGGGGIASANHKNTHKVGGSDAFVSGDLLDATARVSVSQEGALVGTRRGINFIAGSGADVVITDDSGNERVNVDLSQITDIYDVQRYAMML
jgi:hypothetical protein